MVGEKHSLEATILPSTLAAAEVNPGISKKEGEEVLQIAAN